MNVPERPDGLDAIRATFGDPRPYYDAKSGWEDRQLVYCPLPRPLRYAYDPAALITRVRAHRLIASHLVETLMACLDAGVPVERLQYGGAYCWRAKRGGMTLSVHTWGAAVDVEPAANPLGQPWQDDGMMLDPRVVSVFESRGWWWGGHWQRPDAQHFQWPVGY